MRTNKKLVMLIKIQPAATVCRYLFTAKSLYMFRVSQHPSSGVNKYLHTVASGWIFINITSLYIYMYEGTLELYLQQNWAAATEEKC